MNTNTTPRQGSLLVVFLTVFIDLLGFGMVLPLLPVYAKDFARQMESTPDGLSVGAMVGLLMASFSIAQFVCAPLWGRLSDRIGRRPVLMIGLAGSVLFYTAFGIATVYQSVWGLFLSRIGAGVAGATISTAQAYIADTTTPETRARGMALIGAAFGLGFTFGPLFGMLALPSGAGSPGPGPGYAAAVLSAVALGLAWRKLPESLPAGGTQRSHTMFDFSSLTTALATPTVGVLLLISFACVFSFASFESTLAVFIKDPQGAFQFTFRELCLTFAFVGLVLTVVQGGIVRRVAGRIAEGRLAAFGIALEVVGFFLLAQAASAGSMGLLFTSLAIVVGGFAFITPSLNSLISRRSDPGKQGGVMGVVQSVSALARILGPFVGLTLFHVRLPDSSRWPLWMAAALMAGALGMLWAANTRGKDFVTKTTG